MTEAKDINISNNPSLARAILPQLNILQTPFCNIFLKASSDRLRQLTSWNKVLPGAVNLSVWNKSPVLTQNPSFLPDYVNPQLNSTVKLISKVNILSRRFYIHYNIIPYTPRSVK
jgi:uncharacterized membrane-anchored protein